MPNLLENDTKIFLAAESSGPVLAVIGSELQSFRWQALTDEDTSVPFTSILGHNVIEIVRATKTDDVSFWCVYNREYTEAQEMMDVRYDQLIETDRVVYATESEAQRCVLATIACYLGQPDMIVDLVNE